MAIRWLYETSTGNNICKGMTSDDNNTAIPNTKNRQNKFTYAWTQNDPIIIPPATQNLQPLKTYDPNTNEIRLAEVVKIRNWDLRNAKIQKREDVDIKSEELFNKGFTFQENRFPLDVDDSLNYYILFNSRNLSAVITYPYYITKRNGDLFEIRTATVMRQFGEVAIQRQREIINGARDIRKQIYDATTIEELNTIEDNRT